MDKINETKEGYFDDSVRGVVFSAEGVMSRLDELQEKRRSLVAEAWAIQEQIDQLQKQMEGTDPMAEMSLAAEIAELNEAMDEKEADISGVDSKIRDFQNLALSANLLSSQM